MTLNFMTTWPTGGKTHFPAKVLHSHLKESTYGIANAICEYGKHIDAMYADACLNYVEEQTPKLHTIRSGKRWNPGMKIHYKIWTGKPYKSKTFNFFESECISVQDIEITHKKEDVASDGVAVLTKILVDGRSIHKLSEVEQLAKNDGFDNITDFLNYFREDFSGQIIHWTNLKY